MTESQKIELRRSKIRERLAAIAKLDGDDYTDEVQTEERALQDEFQGLEVRYRSAVIAEDAELRERRAEADAGANGDGEPAEVRALRGRARVGAWAQAAIEGRAVAGAEAELASALELPAGRFPLSMLAPPPETRAETDTNAGVMQGDWLDRLFASTAASYLGITMRSVPAGMAAYPVTTAGATPAQRGREEAAADAPWTVGVTNLLPVRASVRAVFTEEDAMRLPGLEEALRRDLSMALTEGVDRSIFLGDAGADENRADVTGLVSAANIVEATINQTGKVAVATVRGAFAGMIDGVHASMVDDLKVVLAVGANTLWMSTSAATNDGNSILGVLKAMDGLRCMTRGGIETATAANDWLGFVGRARGIEGAGVAAVWDSGLFIRDPYSAASSAQVSLSLHYFWQLGFPRPSNFVRIKAVAD